MPDKEGGDLSMFAKVEKLEGTSENHEERISNLEEADRKHDERLAVLEGQYVKLENTMMRESQETRTTMREQTSRLYGIVENAMGIQSAREKDDHERKMARLKVFGDIALKGSGVVLALASSGGIIYFVIEQLFNK